METWLKKLHHILEGVDEAALVPADVVRLVAVLLEVVLPEQADSSRAALLEWTILAG